MLIHNNHSLPFVSDRHVSIFFTHTAECLAEVCHIVTVSKTVTETCSAEVQPLSSSSNYTNAPDMLMKPQALTHYFLVAVACSPGL